MMNRKGAVGAILDIYEQCINELKETISTITDSDLVQVTDPGTPDENCRSVQTILTHVVHSGFGYATSIHNSRGHNDERPPKTPRDSVKEYTADLSAMFAYTEMVLQEIKDDDELEEKDNALKIRTHWDQLYDIEQLMEHAIVHILRHKRQIGRIKLQKEK